MNSSSDYYIVREQTALIRMLSAKHAGDRFFRYVIGILIFYLFADFIPNLVGVFFPRSYFDLMSVNLPETYAASLPRIPYSVVVYNLFLSGSLVLGRAFYTLSFLRNRETDYGLTFDGFGFYIRATVIYLIQMMLMSIGMMAFLFPGVILYYSYRQAFFVYADNPKIGIFGSLSESRRMMRGNKMALFRLDFSYFFLILLAYLFLLLVSMFAPVDVDTLPGLILNAICSIPMYVVLASLYLSQTVFYELQVSHGFQGFRYEGEEVFRGVQSE